MTVTSVSHPCISRYKESIVFMYLSYDIVMVMVIMSVMLVADIIATMLYFSKCSEIAFFDYIAASLYFFCILLTCELQ